MRIAYVAKHGCGGNQDEDAIAFALRKLGHEVICYKERFCVDITEKCDFVLFHHWTDTRSMHNLRDMGIPLVFWNFDLVEWPDPTIEARNATRRKWMHEVMKVVDLGFCTDGDWVAKHPDRLVWLPQGFDERQKPAIPIHKTVPILFTGIGRGGGTQRESFVAEMRDRYGGDFVHYQKGLHGDKLAQTIAESKIVVAPDSPVTDRYWSNRVYNVLGMGGFLLHPYTDGLDRQYFGSIMMYKNRKHLHDTITDCLQEYDLLSDHVRWTGNFHTIQHNTYRHRCEVLVSTVKARLGI